MHQQGGQGMCPMMGQGQGMGMMMGPMRYGQRIGQLANVTVDETREGAVIKLNAKNPKNTQEVAELRAIAKALGAQWQAMAFEPQQPPPAPPPAAQQPQPKK
jgi:hypothetical protein